MKTIKLNSEMYPGYVTKVSDEDYAMLSVFKWYVNFNTDNRPCATVAIYPKGEGGKQVKLSMSRLLLKAKPNQIITYKDNDPLNNTRENLRVCTADEAAMGRGISRTNASGVTGVYKVKRTGKWAAFIAAYGSRYSLGHHVNFDDAVEARKAGETKYFGEFAHKGGQN
jgi:hypothetical protein